MKWRPQPAEMIKTLDAWLKVFISSQQAIYPEDEKRIMSGFTKLIGSDLREWPTPWDVIGKIPKRPEQAQIFYKDPAPEDTNREGIEKLRAVVYSVVDKMET